jgi:hypothetical protein
VSTFCLDVHKLLASYHQDDRSGSLKLSVTSRVGTEPPREVPRHPFSSRSFVQVGPRCPTSRSGFDEDLASRYRRGFPASILHGEVG